MCKTTFISTFQGANLILTVLHSEMVCHYYLQKDEMPPYHHRAMHSPDIGDPILESSAHFDSMPRMWAVLIRSVKGLIWLTAAAIAPLYLTNDTSRNAVIGKGNWLINFMMSELQHLGEAGCLNTRLWLWFWTSVQFSGEKKKKNWHINVDVHQILVHVQVCWQLYRSPISPQQMNCFN